MSFRIAEAKKMIGWAGRKSLADGRTIAPWVWAANKILRLLQDAEKENSERRAVIRQWIEATSTWAERAIKAEQWGLQQYERAEKLLDQGLGLLIHAADLDDVVKLWRTIAQDNLDELQKVRVKLSGVVALNKMAARVILAEIEERKRMEELADDFSAQVNQMTARLVAADSENRNLKRQVAEANREAAKQWGRAEAAEGELRLERANR